LGDESKAGAWYMLEKSSQVLVSSSEITDGVVPTCTTPDICYKDIEHTIAFVLFSSAASFIVFRLQMPFPLRKLCSVPSE
jgi:hypothetical protein